MTWVSVLRRVSSKRPFSAGFKAVLWNAAVKLFLSGGWLLEDVDDTISPAEGEAVRFYGIPYPMRAVEVSFETCDL